MRAAQIHLVDELHQQGVAATRSVSSTAALLRQAFLIAPGEASARINAARNLLPQGLPSGGETPARCPRLRQVVDAGRVDGDHVRTLLATLRRLPNSLPPAVIDQAEATLVDYAVNHDPEQFRRIARHLETVLNPDGPGPGDDTAAKTEFHIGSRSVATGLTGISGHLDDLGVASLRAVIDALATPKPAADGTPDPRPAGKRRADALTEAMTFLLTHGDSGCARTQRPQITVTLDWDLLQRQAAAASVDGHPVSPAQARRLLCDAQIIPAVLGGDGHVLDVGRSTRTFPTAIRHAITLRDRGCAWPGCDRPPSWCDAHHIRYWERDLGPTSYHNGVLLCAFHHTEIHREQWRIEHAPDGHPHFIPPTWIDHHQTPRRNTLHHTNPIRRQ